MANITDRISKEQFDLAYGHHDASKWISFAYEYFSTSSEAKNLSLKKDIVYFLAGLFVFGLVGTVFNFARALVALTVIPYCFVLAVLVLYLFSAVILNNIRIGKIKKELGINSDEYNALVSVYYS
jgi:phosphoglycerol transferase MdoB-like AlkP superfamily enzyme